MGVCDDCKNESVEFFITPKDEDQICKQCHMKRLRRGNVTSNDTRPRGRGRPPIYRKKSDQSGSHGVAEPANRAPAPHTTSQSGSNTHPQYSTASTSQSGAGVSHHQFTRSAERPHVLKVYTINGPLRVCVTETDTVQDVVKKLQEDGDVHYDIQDAEDEVRYAKSFPFCDILPRSFIVNCQGISTTINPPQSEAVDGGQVGILRRSPEKAAKKKQTSRVNFHLTSPNPGDSARATDSNGYPTSTQPDEQATRFETQSGSQPNVGLMGSSEVEVLPEQPLDLAGFSGGDYSYHHVDAAPNSLRLDSQPSNAPENLLTAIGNPANNLIAPQLNTTWDQNNAGIFTNSGTVPGSFWSQIFSNSHLQPTFNSAFSLPTSAQGQAPYPHTYASNSDFTGQLADVMNFPQDLSSFRQPQPQLLTSTAGNDTAAGETLGLLPNPNRTEASTIPFEALMASQAFTRPSRPRSIQPATRSAGVSRSCSPQPRPADLSQPPTSHPTAEQSYSTIKVEGSVKLTSRVKLRHLKTVSTSEFCYTVTHDPDGQVIHGGSHYDSLNGTRDDLRIQCIRAAPDDQLIMMEWNDNTNTTHAVTYQLDERPTTKKQKLSSTVTSNAAYKQVHKLQVQYSYYGITQFTKVDDILIEAGGVSGKLYFYKYSTGRLIWEVTHPDMKKCQGICHDTNRDIYVTDFDYNSIFKVTLNMDDESPSITKLNCKIAAPVAITSHDGLLVVLCATDPVPELHIITTTGENVKTFKLHKCNNAPLRDLSINTRGVVAIARGRFGFQLYKLE